MALTGELSDLSLAELIEFFCNQRKTGRLRVVYPLGAGYFYLKNGAVIHAHIGDLRGIDAVFFALTQPNASFKFSPAFEAPEQTINQPWTSVVLEGLRRMDEGVTPRTPSVLKAEEEHEAERESVVTVTKVAPTPVSTPAKSKSVPAKSNHDVKAFGVLLSASDSESFARRRWHPALVVAAVFAVIAAIGIPWGWYTHKRNARMSSEASASPSQMPATATVTEPQTETPVAQAEPSTNPEAESELAKRQREAKARERARAQEQAAANNPDASKPAASSAANKRAVVTVTYDENGRVTAASGGDATALRIARQKRFPPGKPGSATVTIPIN
jgi:Tfp pilus assembly major pilin PilA